MGDLSDTIIDGDPFDINEGGEGGGGFDPTSLPVSTNTPADADEIVTGESGAWVRKALSKLWDYTKDKLGIKSNGDAGKYLNEKGEWNSLVDARSYVGMVVHSTTFDTEAKVKAFYGGTTWIQHSGYVLRGATSSVTANSAVKDGGQDSVTPSGTNSGGSVNNHKLTVTEMPAHNHDTGARNPGNAAGLANLMMSAGSYSQYTTAGGSTDILSWKWNWGVNTQGGSGNHNHGFTNPTFTGNTHTNLPAYKNVYIWERTA